MLVHVLQGDRNGTEDSRSSNRMSGLRAKANTPRLTIMPRRHECGVELEKMQEVERRQFGEPSAAADDGALGDMRAMGSGTAAEEQERERRWEDEKAALLVELGKLRTVRPSLPAPVGSPLTLCQERQALEQALVKLGGTLTTPSSGGVQVLKRSLRTRYEWLRRVKRGCVSSP